MNNIEQNMGLPEIMATLVVIRIRFQVYLEVYEELKVTVSTEKIIAGFELFIDLLSKAKEIADDKEFEKIKEKAKETMELYHKLMESKSQK
jgi:hypothetical protein